MEIKNHRMRWRDDRKSRFGESVDIFLIGDEAVTDPPAIDPYRKYEMILRHMDFMLKIKGDVQTVNEMRKHIAWYLKGFKYAAKIRDSIFKIDDLEGVKKELERIFAKGGLEDA